MDAQEKIRNLQREIDSLQMEIRRCQHEYGEPENDPEVKKEAISEMRAQGSDIFYETVGYRDVTVNRWSRKCNKCGVVQYSYKQEPVITGYKPKF